MLVGFQGCLIHAVDELERNIDRLRRLIKSKLLNHQFVPELYAYRVVRNLSTNEVILQLKVKRWLV